MNLFKKSFLSIFVLFLFIIVFGTLTPIDEASALSVPYVIPTSFTVTGPTSATLGGNILSAGDPATITERGICFTPVTGSPITPFGTCVVEGGTSTGVFTKSVTGLAASTNYYYYPYAKNSTGTSNFPIGTFTTNPATVPTLTTTTPITSIASTTATGGGTISSNGGATITVSGLVWSTSINPTTANSKTTNGAISGTWTSGITGLTPNTLYYVRAYATNSVGTAYGANVTFTTLPPPTVPTITSPTFTSVGSTTVTVGANVTSAGIPSTLTARGTCLSTNGSPTNCIAEGGTTTGVFTHTRTGLNPGTTYYLYGYATNATGTNFTSSSSFTTLPSGSITASDCTIAIGSSSCNTSLVWSTTGPIGTSTVTTPTSITVATANSSAGTAYSVAYGSRDFSLYNNGVLLDTATATASCASGTSYWNGAVCATGSVPTIGPGYFAYHWVEEEVELYAFGISPGVPATISEMGFCYSQAPAHYPSKTNGATCISTLNGVEILESGAIRYYLGNLIDNTFYYVRAYATNATGTGYSYDERTISTF